MLFRSIILNVAGLGFVKNTVTRSKLFRPMVTRFVAGETSGEALDTAMALWEEKVPSSLDLLGENVTSEADAKATLASYVELVHMAAERALVENVTISIKLSALGLDLDECLAESNYRELLAEAKRHGMFVTADMESSDYTDRTISMVLRVAEDFDNTGTVLQSMMKRTPKDIEAMVAHGLPTRLVKGAYLEPASVAHQKKVDVDVAYVEGAKRLLTAGNYPAIATHDETIVEELKRFVDEKGIAKESFEWQMLYGIRRDLQKRLHQQGYNVRVYIPFGGSWYPYFTRRLAERPANLFFITRAMLNK
jgi:proline dehydrogenase